MKKSLASLFGLLVLFIILAVLVVIQDPREADPIQPTTPPSGESTQVFSQNVVYNGLDASAIQAIRLYDSNSDQSVTFARNPIQLWTAPYIEGVALDQEVMRAVERTLVLMPYAHQFMPEAQRLTEYGFLSDGTHYFSILLVMDDGTAHSIAVGNPTEYDGRAVYYVVIDDRPEMYLIYREPIDYLTSQFLRPAIIS